jgi:hypothetical protein
LGGWFTAQNGGGTAFLATAPVTAGITVYAKWTATASDGDVSGVPASFPSGWKTRSGTGWAEWLAGTNNGADPGNEERESVSIFFGAHF